MSSRWVTGKFPTPQSPFKEGACVHVRTCVCVCVCVCGPVQCPVASRVVVLDLLA